MIDAHLSADYSAFAREPAYRSADSRREWRPAYPAGYVPREVEALPRYDIKPQEPTGPVAAPAAPPLHARDLNLDLARAHETVRARAQARRALDAGYLQAQKPASRTPAEHFAALGERMAERVATLLLRTDTPMTIAEIGAALGYSANTTRYGIQHLMSEERPRIARRQLRAGKANIYQYQAAGRDWPPPPEGAREVRRSPA